MTKRNNSLTEEYLKIVSEVVKYSNLFNMSFGNLTESEMIMLSFLVNQVNQNNIDNEKLSYEIPYDLLAKVLNKGKNYPRGKKEILKSIVNTANNLVKQSFKAPIYNGNKIPSLIIGSFFDYIEFISDNSEKKSIIVKYRFSHAFYPYVLRIKKLNYGYYGMPLDIVLKASSKKVLILLHMVAGCAKQQKESKITLSPQNWNNVFNGDKRIETARDILRDMKQMVKSINEQYREDILLALSYKKSSKRGRPLENITISTKYFSKRITSIGNQFNSKVDQIQYNKVDFSTSNVIDGNKTNIIEEISERDLKEDQEKLKKEIKCKNRARAKWNPDNLDI